MARYPGAKWDPIPENATQAKINPTQFIVHSIVAPWTADRLGDYWRESTSLESHFGLGYEGDLNQYLDTTVRADANASANVRAISIETASNTSASDPWTAKQLEKLVQLGVWVNKEHGIPAKAPSTWNSAGMGYHRMFPSWSTNGTNCPGNARVKQWDDYVLPEIQRRIAQGEEPPPPAPTPEGILMSEVLNSHNAIDHTLASQTEFTGLAFGSDRPNGPAVLHGAGWKHDTRVHLYFDYAVPQGTIVCGRFYLTDPDGINGRSNFLDERYSLHGGGVTFHNSGVVPEGKHLRFEVWQKNPYGEPVKLLHRLATGFYEAV